MLGSILEPSQPSLPFPQDEEEEDEEQQELRQRLARMQAAAEWPWARQDGTPLCAGVPTEVAFGGESEQRAVMAQRARGVAPYRAASFPPGQAPPTPQVHIAFKHSLPQLAASFSKYAQQQLKTPPADCVVNKV